MGEIIELNNYLELPDWDSLSREDLEDWLHRLRLQLAALDAQEPEDMESEAYEDWGDRHEELEDLVDEILDRLDG